MTEYIKREDVLKILSGKNAPWDGYQKCKDLPAEDVISVVILASSILNMTTQPQLMLIVLELCRMMIWHESFLRM